MEGCMFQNLVLFLIKLFSRKQAICSCCQQRNVGAYNLSSTIIKEEDKKSLL